MKKQMVSIMMFFIWGISVSIAQNKLEGTVKSLDGTPLPGANLTLQETYFGTSSDQEGRFIIRKVPSGKYTLVVSYIGFETVTEKLEIHESLKLNIQLKPAEILADEVMVTATRVNDQMPVAHTNLSKQEIEKRNLGQDIPYLLNQSPSLVVTSDAGAGVGYTSFRIRGTDMSRINITVNGIPLNDPESHGTWFVDLPDFATSVDNVQIQRGVGTSTNGAGAFGATVNFKTFNLKKDPGVEINVAAGSFNTFKTSLMMGTGLLEDKFSFDVRLSGIHSDGYIDRAFSYLGSAGLAGAYYGKKDLLKLIYLTGKEKTYQAWDGVPGEVLDTNRTYNGMGAYTDVNGNLRYYDNETDNYLQNHLQLFYSREFRHFLYLNLALHYTKGAGYYEQYKENRKFADYGLSPVFIGGDTLIQTDLIRQKWLDNDFYGITYSLNYKNRGWDFIFGGSWNSYSGAHFGTVIWSRFLPQADHNYEWYRNTGLKKDFNVYGKINARVLQGLNFFADLQIRKIHYDMKGPDDDLRNITQKHEFLFFNPKLGLNFDLSGNQKIFFSWSVGNREPNRYNYKDADPDKPSPTNETLYDYEAGYRYNTEHLLVHVNFYYMDYHNQLALTGEINDVGSPVMTNVDKSFRRGIEISSAYKINRNFSWDFNATLSQNKILNYTELVDDWDTWMQHVKYLGITNLSFSPEFILNNSFIIKIGKNINFNLISKYVGKQYIDNTSSENRMLNAYFINNLVGEYHFKTRWAKQISFRLLVNNLFNNLYESSAWVYRYYYQNVEESMTGFYPQAGRNFLTGISVKF